jgi:hypothetical protein
MREKTCEFCAAKFRKPSKQALWQWRARRFCSHACASKSQLVPVEDRFEHRAMPEPNSGCWLWLGALNKKGYGIVNSGRGSNLAHRVSFLLYKGEIPTNMKVLHRCDNPCCVNPEHLFLGTPADNSEDMITKGRSSYGEKHYNAKLTEQDVLSTLNSGESSGSLAAHFSVSVWAIHDVRNNRTWKHLQR